MKTKPSKPSVPKAKVNKQPWLMVPSFKDGLIPFEVDRFVLPQTVGEFFVSTLAYRWIKLPSGKSREPWTQLSRSVLNTLILPCPANRYRPPVRSASFIKPGQRKSTRLIHLQSLLDYVEGKAEATALAAGAARAKHRNLAVKRIHKRGGA